MAKNFHIEPFDEGTLLKLELLRLYVRSWVPVFLSKDDVIWKEIYIYDFFAGAGMDAKGNSGSPLIILNELSKYCPTIIKKGLKVRVLFNEPQKEILSNLNNKINVFFEECREKGKFSFCKKCSFDNCPFILEIERKEFKTLFEELYPTMQTSPNLPRFMFLDQFGIKQITQEIFQKLTSLKRTDFLFFISSSFLHRFSELEEFQRYLKVNKEDFDQSRREHCHRIILDYYRASISNSEYFLAPFSIRKGANIYGLIFGSNSPRGMEKYLDAAWSIDKNTGEANFNIDNDIILTGQLSLFQEDNVIKKIDVFEENLLEWLKQERTNEEIYLFTLSQGMRKKHANEILKRNKSHLEITSIDKIQKGAFYLGYKPTKHIRIKYYE